MKSYLTGLLLLLMCLYSVTVPTYKTTSIEGVSSSGQIHNKCCCKGHVCHCDAKKSACCTLSETNEARDMMQVNDDGNPIWMAASCAVRPFDAEFALFTPNKLFLIPHFGSERHIRLNMDRIPDVISIIDSAFTSPLDKPPRVS